MRFIAPIATTIYGVDYAAGAEVDTDTWNRAQFVQMLAAGMISLNTGADVAIMEAVAYTFVQAVPASTWYVAHPLDFIPSVTIVDSAGTGLLGDVEVIDVHNLCVTFTAPFSGSAYLS